MEKDKKTPIVKKYYTVKVEGIVPITVTYKILAESPEEALELSRRAIPVSKPQPILNKLKKIKATVYSYGSLLVHLTKSF